MCLNLCFHGLNFPFLAKWVWFSEGRLKFFSQSVWVKMIQLLFLVLFAEGIVALLLMVKIGPLRELVMKGLDQVKMGKGPATVKTIAGTMSVILLSSVTSILKIQNKGAKLGTMTPMDQVLWRTHLLETSLMGMIPLNLSGFLLLYVLLLLHLLF